MTAKPLPRRITDMHRMYGTEPGLTCKTCGHLTTNPTITARKYYKCALNTMTSGPATDWRLSWPACGKYAIENENADTREMSR